MAMQSPVIILPGIGGSGPQHWQSQWEDQWQASARPFLRMMPTDWDQPDLEDWIMALDAALAQIPAPPVLVADSLSCLLVAHWAARQQNPALRAIKGAFMVAVPNPASSQFPAEALGFASVPQRELPFPTLLVGSENDPYARPEYMMRCARNWGAGMVMAGALGHINEASNIDDWPQGQALLTAFCTGLG
jgi:predicted alpha/beta hydrolase family esterase